MVGNSVRALLLALSLSLVGASADAQSKKAGSEDDPVAAIVNGAEIRRSEIILARRSLSEQYQNYPFDLVYPVLLDRMIDAKLVSIEGHKADLADDDDVNTRMLVIKERVIREVYLERFLAGAITDEALQALYQEFLKSIPPEEEVRARHILQESEEEAKALIQEIKGGADFTELAKKKSTGPSASSGGDLGYFARGKMLPEFAEAAFKLKPGEFTLEPVKTKYGWHVIKVEDRRLAEPPSFEDTRGRFHNELSQKAIGELLKKLREQATIERFNLDGSKREE